MRLAPFGSSLVLLALTACLAETAPNPPPAGDLDGQWGWEFNGNPGGSSLNISFVTSGSQVTGTGQICGIGPNCSPGSVTITGSHVPTYGAFDLTMAGSTGYRASFAGHFLGQDTLQGTWVTPEHTGALTLVRCSPTSLCW